MEKIRDILALYRARYSVFMSQIKRVTSVQLLTYTAGPNLKLAWDLVLFWHYLLILVGANSTLKTCKPVRLDFPSSSPSSFPLISELASVKFLVDGRTQFISFWPGNKVCTSMFRSWASARAASCSKVWLHNLTHNDHFLSPRFFGMFHLITKILISDYPLGSS